MAKIQIKNRYTGEIIIEGEAESIKELLENNHEADLYGADLREADLRGAKIKFTQKEELLKGIGIITEN